MRKLVTAPAVEPCTKVEVGVEGRVTIAAELTRLEGYIVPARVSAATLTNRAICTQTWDLVLPAFPGVIEVPLPPLQSITSITYLDPAGTSTVLAATAYTVSIPLGDFAAPATIEPAYGYVWPATRNAPNAVTLLTVPS